MSKNKDLQLEQTMTMYEYAKQVAAAEVPMDFIGVNIKCTEMAKYISNCQFAMLLCKERGDYSIFHISGDKTIEFITKELRETIQNRGKLLVADLQEDNTYEIWIRDSITKENFAYYLFNYDSAIIEV